jgi:S-methylmethionine-dependent homocysteine/selenocysteine methylase
MLLLLDGPMGTELARRGVATPAPGWSAYALDDASDVVRAIHEDYARAGARVHRANTFRAQPRLFPHRYRAMAARAVALAREAAVGGGSAAGAGAHDKPRVAGCLAPIEDCYRPDLSPPPDVARPLHRALAEALRDARADLLVCETFPNAREACVAVEEAVRTGLPTWVSLTAGPLASPSDTPLLTPEAMERAAKDCVSAGASAVLVACTAASRTLPFVERIARAGAPFGAYANAGEDWDADPLEAAARYADRAADWIAAGATILGSCCGTRPAHVAAMEARFVSRV